jgi:hypothetical protein
MKFIAWIVLSALFPAAAAWAAPSQPAANATLIAEGRHLVVIGGCNYCHTEQWSSTNGQVPEKDWLEGSQLGWYGPWGTSYPANLRLFIPQLAEQDWVAFAHVFRANPPMPWFDVHRLTDHELEAIYAFVKHLGPTGKPAPSDLPPSEKPKPPYINMSAFDTAAPTHPKPQQH